MAQKFKAKPVVIEAIQLSADNFEEVEKFVGYTDKYRRVYKNEQDYITNKNADGLLIEILGGNILKASLGDYIIKGIDGKFYPCKPDIFEATYEKAE